MYIALMLTKNSNSLNPKYQEKFMPWSFLNEASINNLHITDVLIKRENYLQ